MPKAEKIQMHSAGGTARFVRMGTWRSRKPSFEWAVQVFPRCKGNKITEINSISVPNLPRPKTHPWLTIKGARWLWTNMLMDTAVSFLVWRTLMVKEMKTQHAKSLHALSGTCRTASTRTDLCTLLWPLVLQHMHVHNMNAQVDRSFHQPFYSVKKHISVFQLFFFKQMDKYKGLLSLIVLFLQFQSVAAPF